MEKAYGYVRVSSKKQAKDGESLDVQQRQIELICELEHYQLQCISIESGVSASKALTSRPEGRKLLEAVNSGDVIVVTKLDRLFRDLEDASSTLKILKAKGVSLYVRDLGGDVTRDGVSGLVFNLLSSVAQFERECISERVKDVKGHLREQGRYLGGKVPFGKRVTWSTNPDNGKRIGFLQEDYKVTSLVRDLRDREFSTRMIAVELKLRGHNTDHNTIARS